MRIHIHIHIYIHAHTHLPFPLHPRYCVTLLRSMRLSTYLPLDENIHFHKVVGIVIVIQSAVHAIAHLANICEYFFVLSVFSHFNVGRFMLPPHTAVMRQLVRKYLLAQVNIHTVHPSVFLSSSSLPRPAHHFFLHTFFLPSHDMSVPLCIFLCISLTFVVSPIISFPNLSIFVTPRIRVDIITLATPNFFYCFIIKEELF